MSSSPQRLQVQAENAPHLMNSAAVAEAGAVENALLLAQAAAADETETSCVIQDPKRKSFAEKSRDIQKLR